MTDNNPNVPPSANTPPSDARQATPPLGSPLGYEPAPEALPAETDNNARLWGMLCHLSALAVFLGIPAGNVLGPLVVWLIKKNEFPFVDDQGKESLNFQIAVLLAVLACVPLFFCMGLGAILAIGIGIAALVFVIIASIKANEGIRYRYPLPFRLIK